MNRVYLVLALLWMGMSGITMAAVAHADGSNCDQSYSEWKAQRDKQGKVVYYFCRYSFQPVAGKQEMNWVVWYPTEKDFTFCYYANSKGNYWCRAITELHRGQDKANPRWNVLTGDANKKPRLNEISADAWSGPKHPICPGSDANGQPGCKMLPPPRPPVESYRELAAAGR